MDIKRISEILSFAVPVLVVCSCINLWTYYYHWNIPIFDYLSASELLFLFTQPLLIIAALAAAYFLGNLLIWGGVTLAENFGLLGKGSPGAGEGAKENTKKSGERNKGENTERSKLVRRIARSGIYAAIIRSRLFAHIKPSWTYLWVKRYRIFSAIVSGIGIGVMVWFFVDGIWFDYDLLPVVILHVFLLLCGVILIHKYTAADPKKLSFETFLAGAIITLVSASFFYGRYQAHYTDISPVPHKFVLKDNSVVQTDENNIIYLGKTSSFCFLYNKELGEAAIIPVGEIKNTVIQRRGQ